jgi:microcystin-dependent protein
MDNFVAEIRLFGFNFPPKGWAQCNGQLLPISQNTALFALLGTYYGGDGVTTFALPDLRDRTPIGAGQGPGLADRAMGETGGAAAVTLTEANLPAHRHGGLSAASAAATSSTAVPGTSALATSATPAYGVASNMAAVAQVVGSGLPHNNRQPCLGTNFCIALQGIFPPRS